MNSDYYMVAGIILILAIQHLVVPRVHTKIAVYVLPVMVLVGSLYSVWFNMSGAGTLLIGTVLSFFLALITLLAGSTSVSTL